MRFWKKFWTAVFAMMTLCLMQVYLTEIGKLEFSLFGVEFAVGLYMVAMFLVLFWLVYSTLKALCVLVASLFTKNKNADEIKSVTGIVGLVVADDHDFVSAFDKTSVLDHLRIIKTALALRRGLLTNKKVEMTGLRCVDIYILRLELKRYIKDGELHGAIGVANVAIKKYAEYVNVIQEELLETAIIARKNGISLHFDPRKFKFNLTPSYAERYMLEMERLDFQLEPDPRQKQRQIEKMLKKYDGNHEVLLWFLKFTNTNESIKYDDERVLSHMKSVLSKSPVRWLAPHLLNLNRKDIFEVAQEQMASVPESNLEKLWLLLELATHLGFITKAKDLIWSIAKLDKTADLFKFYAKNAESFASYPEVTEIMRERANCVSES
jgi:hypothetical protein